MRWDHAEEKRIEKILMIKNERQRVILDEAEGNIVYDEEDGCYRIPTYTNLKNLMKMERIKSANNRKKMTLDGDTAIIKKELQNLENIKRKQQKEFEQKMLYEKQMADIQARNEEK